MADSISHANQLSAAEIEAGDIITESRSVTGHADIQPQEAAEEPGNRIQWGGHNNTEARILPGCQSNDLGSGNCELSVADCPDHLAATLTVDGVRRSWKLGKENGEVVCNLQELTVVRWLVDAYDGATKPSWSSRVRYKPTTKYHCLFPHAEDSCHDIEEVLPAMEEQELQMIADEARIMPCVLLCPAPASTCKGDSCSKGVREEALKLAALIPVRQIISGPPVSGMLDVVPVATCFPTAERKKGACCRWGEKTIGSHKVSKDIRTHKGLGEPGQDWVLDNGHGNWNNDFAMHSSWMNFLSSQPAVLDVEQRKAVVELYPTRLYDTGESIAKEGLQPDCYLAVSYCWAEWDDEPLRERLRQLAQQLGIRYFWVDRWCVKQDDPADKEREIPRMGEYYRGASACVVLLAPGPAKKFQCLPQQNGVILSAAQQIRLNWEGMKNIVVSQWASRVWTLQESLMSRQTIYSIEGQLIDGDFVSEMLAYLEFAHDTGTDKIGCYRWDPRDPVVIPSQHINWDDDGRLTIIRSVYGGEIQYNYLSRAGGEVKMPLEEALVMVRGRGATKEEDYIYGVLGMADGGEKVSVSYPRAWKDMLDELLGLGLITERQLATPVVSQEPGEGWLPRHTEQSAYGPFLEGERLAAAVDRPKLTLSDQGVLVRAAKFRWVWNDLEKPLGPRWTNNIHNMPCNCVRGLIEVEDNLILGAVTSSRPFSKERLSGTHMMLCESIGRETVMVRLSRDSEVAGRFHREDGYVFEVHRFVTFRTVQREGDEVRMGLAEAPRRELQGEQIWII